MSSEFLKTASSRILVLDGAMGSMIQRYDVADSDYLGEHNSDSLAITRPDVVEDIMRRYVEAGADIITTDSFGANRIAQQAYGLQDRAAEMAEAAARIGRKVADSSSRKILVAGSVGPTGRSLSLASNASDPGYRQSSFLEMKEAYKEQMAALIKGGVDLILLETWFDALNAKAAIKGFEELGAPVPLLVSATVSDRSGRTLTGQTLEAFFQSLRHAPRLSAFGINCALGAQQMGPLVADIASFSDLPLIFYPNAGIPDELGNYNDSPEEMAGIIRGYAQKGLLNIVGGCCGTTPEHIRAIEEAVRDCSPRIPASPAGALTVSGLDAYRIDASRNFTNIGERTNVAGSRKFARLIAEGKYDEALLVAAAQIEGGADIIDINMDDAMLDSTVQMRTFLRHISADPSVARAAIMIDSSHWETVVEGLENVQGKSIVNSISLKEGPEEFVRKARHIASMGAAMVVMAFDEEGQATTFDRKVAICRRSYELLTAAGIAPQDIIFDVNVLTIGTGIAEHARFGVDFIEAVRWIKQNLPGALTSGGISNLSFAFRGNNAVREAMHSAFLYHAIKAGLDMAIVNPQMLQIYDQIDPQLLKCVEDVIFDSDPDATARLTAKAQEVAGAAASPAGENRETPAGTAAERICAALVKGSSPTLEADVLESLGELGQAVNVIEGPLMDGMETVGRLFAEGRMFLPQVVKSAKVMRDAVAVLEPYMKSGEQGSARPRVVIATVKGDVHDIGKNITSIVLQCGGFEVLDLGVMVPCEEILAKAEEFHADIIGVSGLITPSLFRMEELCREMASRGMNTPLFVGGAAASALHTAVKLAPLYDNVHYGADASATAVLAKRCISDKEGFIASEHEAQRKLRELHALGTNGVDSSTGKNISKNFVAPGTFRDLPLGVLDTAEVMKHFDWRMFFGICGVKGEDEVLKQEALAILAKGGMDILAEAKFRDCRREGDDIVAADGSLRLPMLRQGSGAKASLADFFPESGTSPLGLFAVKVENAHHRCDCCPDLVEHSLEVCLAEAGSAYLADKFSKATDAKVIMPGIGYACCPDHSLKREVLAVLDIEIELTESCAMIPEASVCGLVIAHEDAFYTDIRRITKAACDEYARRRGMSEEDRTRFLGHLTA